TFYDYALVLREVGEPEAVVVQHLTRAVTLDESFFDGHNYLGHLHLQAERLPDAIRHLKRAAELQPGRVSVLESLAVAHHKAGDKNAARSAAKAARRGASGPEEISRIDALLDLIDSDADKIVLAPEPKKETQSAATSVNTRVAGMLSQVDCLGAQARLHVTAKNDRVLLLVRDAASVRLHGAGSAHLQLECGPSAPRPVLVEYRPEVHRTYGTVGVVISVEIR
ncbi:MAG TPA: tetratricopeptide repeat protein, partial [Bryobacteraceae bacterium]|nr:tetratricopeptide repeat protein [Bryobacteraceae bacterium]